jgi:hypothetical protein
MPLRASASNHPYRLHHSGNPGYIQDAPQVVGQYLKTLSGRESKNCALASGSEPWKALWQRLWLLC